MPDNINLRSFYKEMGVNESFDLPPTRYGRALVINNPNPGSLFIWAGPFNTVDLVGPVEDNKQGTGLVYGDLDEVTPSMTQEVSDGVKAAIRVRGVELPAGGIWEPFYVPNNWVHIVYGNSTSEWTIKGML